MRHFQNPYNLFRNNKKGQIDWSRAKFIMKFRLQFACKKMHLLKNLHRRKRTEPGAFFVWKPCQVTCSIFAVVSQLDRRYGFFPSLSKYIKQDTASQGLWQPAFKITHTDIFNMHDRLNARYIDKSICKSCVSSPVRQFKACVWQLNLCHACCRVCLL